MTEPEVRQMLVEALRAASVFGLRNNGWTAAFLSGERDIAFEDLKMDSFGAMELCIAVEVKTGIEIVPDDLQQMVTLGQMVTAIHQGLL